MEDAEEEELLDLLLAELEIELDDLLLDKLDLLLEEETTELDEVPHALTKPKGDGCELQVELPMQLLPFS